MQIKKMVRIATSMREKQSFLLDISSLTEKEAAFITVLVKDTPIYDFFNDVQDIPIRKLVVVCKYLEYLDALNELNQGKQNG